MLLALATSTLAATLSGCLPTEDADPTRMDVPPATVGLPADSLPTPEDPALAAGYALYLRECAACHGARGEGQPNWKIPRPDGSLPEVISVSIPDVHICREFGRGLLIRALYRLGQKDAAGAWSDLRACR